MLLKNIKDVNLQFYLITLHLSSLHSDLGKTSLFLFCMNFIFNVITSCTKSAVYSMNTGSPRPTTLIRSYVAS